MSSSNYANDTYNIKPLCILGRIPLVEAINIIPDCQQDNTRIFQIKLLLVDILFYRPPFYD